MLLLSCNAPEDRAIEIILVEGAGSNSFSHEDDPGAQVIRAATHEGLVSFDAEGRIRPGIAERWIVTDDGLSYIFRIANGLTAPDGTQVDAAMVRNTLRKAIASQDNTALGLDLDIIDNVRARTGRVVEVQLSAPMPEFLQLLAHPTLALVDRVNDDGMVLSEQDGRASLVPRPIPGTSDASGSSLPIRPLQLRRLAPLEAVTEFEEGAADILLGGGIDALPHVRRGGLLRGTIRLDPVAGLFGLGVAPGGGFLADAANREVLSLALDREQLITPFGIGGGWSPRIGIAPPELSALAGQDAPQWQALPLEQRQAIASARVAQWQAANEQIAPLSIALPQGRGGELILTRLKADYAAIGINLVRADDANRADLWLIDAVSSYSQPDWYLNRLNCKVTRAACSAQADALVEQARSESDPIVRAYLLTRAEAELTAVQGYVSFGQPVRFSLVRGGLAGFAVNPWAIHPLSALGRGPS
ncbi:ABC transporter substrate-binding protein [Croceicoccus sp. F390]|uniref:ABC transporter substrate-binding protein n=1 Tax=Croceicoccus esteveae TaxID=3075597 RepID=A0ABU2ZJE9_9SPHN|nr:ABC transporter substrate-binding protein [Croceicoccus sp. F390]MDT0576511.1 ABC transporter substrate-binding protein [Croceicoccus sp. F390]